MMMLNHEDVAVADPAATYGADALLTFPAAQVADALNHGCYCRTLNPERLRDILERASLVPGQLEEISRTRPHLFSSTAVFLSEGTADRISAAIEAIERVIATAPYQEQALARAPALAARGRGPQGVCMGYDFHLSTAGPRLIEINTNAGGLLLNAALARAQESCCEAMNAAFRPRAQPGALEASVMDMFQQDWSLQRGNAPLRSIAIVDVDPAVQYLAPEFTLFQQMFLRHGIQAVVVDPADLRWQGRQLLHGPTVVDMVYNRLTDFYLQEPAHADLRAAYEAGAVVVSPDPHAHALYADKRNLIALSRPETLAQWPVSAEDRRTLQAVVPATRLVTQDAADELWAQRKQLFFKPVAGYGAKAAYRGDKLTRRVWGEILAGEFVAQALVPPSERMIELDGVVSDLKFDVRAYTYAGRVQLLAARMYSGQTTNFRTEGGGFAPVIIVPA